MAIKVTLSFKDNVDDVLLYNFLEDQAKIIGKSAYIKSLLKEKLEQEQEKSNKQLKAPGWQSIGLKDKRIIKI